MMMPGMMANGIILPRKTVYSKLNFLYIHGIKKQTKYMQTQIAVLQKGGMIGQSGIRAKNGLLIIKTFGDDKIAAKEYAKRLRKTLTKTDRSYYRMSYTIGTCDATIQVGK
jgi:hypothetical protein